MSTSLSRHLFRLDEVAAALRYSVIERRIEEGMYWTEELIDSQEFELLFETLLDAWVFAIGPARISFLSAFSQVGKQLLGGDETNVISSLRLLSFSLLKLPKTAVDGSVLAIATLAIEDLMTPTLENQMETLSISGDGSHTTSAILRGDVRAAARWIFRGEPITSIIFERRALQAAARSWRSWAPERFQTPIWGPLWRLIDLLIVMMPEPVWLESSRPCEVILSPAIQELLAGWQALQGRRRRRSYKISPVQIKWLTVRGRMPYSMSTMPDMHTAIQQHLRGCKYWDRKVAEFGLSDVTATWEDAWDGFMNFAFPDDIPDEWSAADREWSHGDGFLVPGTAPSRPNWFRSWYPSSSVAFVKPEHFKRVLQIVETSTIGPDAMHMDQWLAVAAGASS